MKLQPTLPPHRLRARSPSRASPSTLPLPRFTYRRAMYVIPFSLLALATFTLLAPQPIPLSRLLSISLPPPAAPSTLPSAPPPSDHAASHPTGRRLHAAARLATVSPVISPPVSRSSTSSSTSSTSSTSSSLRSSSESNSSPASQPEANIAYFLQIADSTVAHLPRLLARIYHPHNHYAIHFDKKIAPQVASDLQKQLLAADPRYAHNVICMPQELITYRGVSMLLNTINAMSLLLQRSDGWQYFINLSGADYPLVSQQTMRRLLGQHMHLRFNFISYAPPEMWVRNKKFRLKDLYIDDALSFQQQPGKVHQLPQSNPLADSMHLHYTTAEAWMINSRQLCHFVVTSGYARKMLLTFAYSIEASEHYFATMLWNHPVYNRTIVPHAMRLVVWTFDGKHAGQHPYYVDQQDEDGRYILLPRLDRSPNFFSRKFRHADSELMDYLDGRWENDTLLQRVNTKFRWVIESAMADHAAKPKLTEDSES